MATAKKMETVEGASELFQKSAAFFVTEYQGLTVADMTRLRKTLRDKNINYLVAKNTLLKLAAHHAGVTTIDKYLKGPTAIAFAMNDPAEAAKALNDHFKEKELPKIRAFVLDEQLLSGTEIGRLADLPPREILLSQVVGAVEAPLTSLVGSLDGFFRELVGSIDALAEKQKGAA